MELRIPKPFPVRSERKAPDFELDGSKLWHPILLPDRYWHQYVRLLLQSRGLELTDEKQRIDFGELLELAIRHGMEVLAQILMIYRLSPADSHLYLAPPQRAHRVSVIWYRQTIHEVSVPAGVDLIAIDDLHPTELRERYPNRLWVMPFWPGGMLWFHALGLPHVVVADEKVLAHAWLTPSTRAVPVRSTDGSLMVGREHLALPQVLPLITKSVPVGR